MCEPKHSIVQYPDDHDDDASGQSYVKSILQGLGQWGKRIGNWFHLSKMGKGHSEAVGQVSKGSVWQIWDTLTNYECFWWDRKVELDGMFRGKIDKETALSSAKEYAKQVSIGSLTSLRRFLEASIKQTERPTLYLQRFHSSFLNQRGKKDFERRLRVVDVSIDKANLSKDALTKLMLGYTRRRGLLVPAWADDVSLWK